MRLFKKYWMLYMAVVLVLAFIWGNSLMNGEESGAVSGGMLAWLKELIPALTGMGELLLRKLGHFSEFTLLGILLALLMAKQPGFQRISLPLLLGILAAMTDETIQSFVPGRSSRVMDVWIDTAGVAAGIVLVLLGQAVLRKRMNSKKGKDD